MYRLQILIAEERRQLHEPGRRVLLEDPHDLIATGLAAEAPQRLEHRQIGLAGAVLLHALSPADAQQVRAVDPREKRVDQRRLADPRLAGHEDELSLPAHHLPQQLV